MAEPCVAASINKQYPQGLCKGSDMNALCYLEWNALHDQFSMLAY